MMDMKELNKLQMIKDSMINSEVSGIRIEDAKVSEVKNINGDRVDIKENNTSNKTNYNDTYNKPMEIKRGDNLLIQLEYQGVGSEQSGTRNAICIQNDVANLYSPTIIVAFVTSRLNKAKLPVHVEIKAPDFGFSKDSVVLVEQIRTIDKKRIIKKVGHIDEQTMSKIDNAIDISVKTLKPKSLLEKLPELMRQYVTTTLKQIKKYEITIETMKNEGMTKDEVSFMVNKKMTILNKFIKYCTEHQIDYKAFYEINKGVNSEIVL